MTREQRTSRRYLRLAVTMEVEILDAAAAASRIMALSVDEEGNEGMRGSNTWGGELTPDEGAVVEVVDKVVRLSLKQFGPECGFKVKSGPHVQPRLLERDGENYGENYQRLVWPAEGQRRDDGSMPEAEPWGLPG